MRHIALMISKQAQEEQASYYCHLCATISTRQKSDKSPITPLHSSSLSPNPPFQCGGFVASKHEGCASRVVRGVCSGLWVAGCRHCSSGSRTQCSAERGSVPDGWHRYKIPPPKNTKQNSRLTSVLLPECSRRCYLNVWRGFSLCGEKPLTCLCCLFSPF